MSEKIKLKIVDTHFGHHGTISFLGSKYIEWIHNFDVYPDDIIFFSDNCVKAIENVKCKGRIAILIEPEEVEKEAYEYIRNNHKYFHYIFTHDQQLIEQLAGKAFWFPPSTTWIKNRGLHKKTHLMSMIASIKNDTSGQKLRNEIVKKIPTRFIDIFGFGRKYDLKSKEGGLNPYMFSIVVENTTSDDFFTEKILDAFATGTVPIYWGTKNIGKYFDEHGIIQFTTIDEVLDIINILTPMAYEDKRQAITNNWLRTERYLTSTEDFLWEFYNPIFSKIHYNKIKEE